MGRPSRSAAAGRGVTAVALGAGTGGFRGRARAAEAALWHRQLLSRDVLKKRKRWPVSCRELLFGSYLTSPFLTCFPRHRTGSSLRHYLSRRCFSPFPLLPGSAVE